jgi:hypothetical protein
MMGLMTGETLLQLNIIRIIRITEQLLHAYLKRQDGCTFDFTPGGTDENGARVLEAYA